VALTATHSGWNVAFQPLWALAHATTQGVLNAIK